MAFSKSTTITATKYNKGPMVLDRRQDFEGNWYVIYSQSYVFTTEEGIATPTLQNKTSVSGSILETELATNLPDIWNSLVFLWTFHDDQIKQQEGIE